MLQFHSSFSSKMKNESTIDTINHNSEKLKISPHIFILFAIQRSLYGAVCIIFNSFSPEQFMKISFSTAWKKMNNLNKPIAFLLLYFCDATRILLKVLHIAEILYTQTVGNCWMAHLGYSIKWWYINIILIMLLKVF